MNKEDYIRAVREHLEDVAMKISWKPMSYPCTAKEAQVDVLKSLDLARERIANIDPNDPVAPKPDINGFYENERARASTEGERAECRSRGCGPDTWSADCPLHGSVEKARHHD